MSLRVNRSKWFVGDLEHYTAWYQDEASWEIAERYLRAVSTTVARLAETPGIGHVTRFPNPILRGIRCRTVDRPFGKHLIFYRHDDSTLYLERAIHGVRNLPRRLLQSPSAPDL